MVEYNHYIDFNCTEPVIKHFYKSNEDYFYGFKSLDLIFEHLTIGILSPRSESYIYNIDEVFLFEGKIPKCLYSKKSDNIFDNSVSTWIYELEFTDNSKFVFWYNTLNSYEKIGLTIEFK